MDMDRQFSFLVVDDDESFRELCTRFLESLGHKAEVACDGQEALSRLRREWFAAVSLGTFLGDSPPNNHSWIPQEYPLSPDNGRAGNWQPVRV